MKKINLATGLFVFRLACIVSGTVMVITDNPWWSLIPFAFAFTDICEACSSNEDEAP